MRGGQLWQLGQSITRRLSQADKKTVARRCFASEADLKKTVLYDFHVAHGGKMVPFAGWSMPIQYKDSIMESTLNCRENGSLFDVSHMCGLSLKGKDCIPFLEKLVVADVAGLAPGTGCLTVFTNEKGGAIDDSVITKVTNDHIYLVVNAGCRDKDLAHIEAHMKSFTSKGGDVSWHIHDERSLLALQGPLAAPVLQHLTKEDLSKIYFSDFRMLDINGAPCFLTRTGYTGEDGFEISVPSENAVDLAKAILDKSEAHHTCGSRTYMAIGKRRRAEGGFLGAEVILKQIEEGPKIRRVGLFSAGPPARSHSEIQDEKGENIGEVTSGGFSPCLKKNIAMGYVKSGLHKAGTKLKVVVRGKSYDGSITKMPFVPSKLSVGSPTMSSSTFPETCRNLGVDGYQNNDRKGVNTAVMGSVAKKGLQQYLIQLQQHPLRTKVITAGVLSAISDIVAQKLSGIQKLQIKRLLLKVLFGAAYLGPLGHYFHMLLDKIFKGKKDTKTVAKKVVLEQLTISPWNNMIFMIYYGFIIEGESVSVYSLQHLFHKLRVRKMSSLGNSKNVASAITKLNGRRPWIHVKSKIKKEYPTVQYTAWSFWPVVGWVNHQYVPLQFRVILQSVVACFWGIFLNLRARSMALTKAFSPLFSPKRGVVNQCRLLLRVSEP
ncbi:UNVERIFIED_CONTAM: Aminomethyltransferase, mitochondrial [Sesamum latifolium]|uniref:aminomethyltransferase n=1 Tax=Sesamum latifolium TaxID=2727402 RepID=A0AAW2WR06_9LAMI